MTSVVMRTSDEGFEKEMMMVSNFSEIEEENSGELFEIKEEVEGSLFSFDIEKGEVDVVYVVVVCGIGKMSEDSNMDALLWTLKHAVNPPSTLVYLIHVFPELRHIPTPLGKLPISQVNPEQKENYLIQERSKRREFLHRFLDKCSASKVQVETILIESDMEAKAILDLIPILNIRKLVLGTTKSNLRKLTSRRGSGIADQILQNAPESCEVKIICEGKEVFEEQMIQSPSPRRSDENPKPMQEQVQTNDSFTCNCFKPKVVP